MNERSNRAARSGGPRAWRCLIAGCIGIALWPTSSLAGPLRIGDLERGDRGKGRAVAGAEVGYEAIDGEGFLSLLLLQSDRSRSLRLGIGVPLRLDLDDGSLRERDWDQVSDFARPLRFLEVGDPGQPIHFRLGDVSSSTLGHGTLINQYASSLGPDEHHMGLWLEARPGGALVEGMVDDLLAPAVVASRLVWRPFGGRVQVGGTLAADLDAPGALRGACPVEAQASCAPQDELLEVDADGRPVVARKDVLVLGGGEIAADLLHRPGLHVVSYLDLNGIVSHGAGLHAGLLVAAEPGSRLSAGLRLEYRYATAEYRPAYVGTFYAMERFDQGGQPAAEALSSLEGGHGAYGELAFSVERYLTLAAVWEWMEGQSGGDLTLRAEVPGPGFLRAAVLYRRARVGELGQAFEPEGAFIVSELRAQVTSLLYLAAHYGRYWTLREPAPRTDPYRTAPWWGAGAGLAIAF